jgi:hypothetical protein
LGRFPVLVTDLLTVSNRYEELDEAPSFFPPNMIISVADTGHEPNQYLMSFSKL